MKSIVIALALLSSSAFATTSGDKIFFQKDSSWISGLGKNICVNESNNTYYALVSKCVKWTSPDQNFCAKEAKVVIAQPVASTKEVCTKWTGGEQNGCRQFKTVSFVQSPDMTVTYYNDRNDTVIKTIQARVKSCE